MARSVVKVQKNKNITLPMWVMRHCHLATGDFLQVQEVKGGVMLKPAKLVDPGQAYFWTNAWQTGERAAEQDIRRGRITAFKNIKELIHDLKKT